jgi:hypothetical protein
LKAGAVPAVDPAAVAAVVDVAGPSVSILMAETEAMSAMAVAKNFICYFFILL